LKTPRWETRRGESRGPAVLLALSVCVLAATGCGTALHDSGTPKELSVLQLSGKPTQEIGTIQGDSDYVFGNVASVRHLTSGNLLVADAMADEIFEYAPNGTLVRRIGRKGDGPSEFRALSHLHVIHGDSILAEDGVQGRVSVFDSAGHFVHQVAGADLSGDSLFALDVWLYGRFWVDGGLLAADRKRIRAVLDKLPPPVSDPGYRYVQVDETGRLWIREPGVSAGDRRMWTIVDTDGRPTASLAIPVRFEPEEIGESTMTGRWRGDNDVNFVRTYTYGGTGQVRATPAWLVGPPPPAVPPETQQQFLTAIKASLKNLAVAQEIHYSKAYTYADQLDSLEAFHPDPSMQVDLISGDTRGWAAVFAHPGIDRICGLAYGYTIPPGWEPGVFVCSPAPRTDSAYSGS